MDALDFEISFRNTLLANAGIQACVGNRVFAVVVPSGTALPCISFQRIEGNPTHVLGGMSGLERIEMQVDIWARSLEQAKDAARAVRKAVPATGPVWGARLLLDRDRYESEATNYYRIRMDYAVWLCEDNEV